MTGPTPQTAITLSFWADRVERVRIKLDFVSRLLDGQEGEVVPGIPQTLEDLAVELSGSIQQLRWMVGELCSE